MRFGLYFVVRKSESAFPVADETIHGIGLQSSDVKYLLQ